MRLRRRRRQRGACLLPSRHAEGEIAPPRYMLVGGRRSRRVQSRAAREERKRNEPNAPGHEEEVSFGRIEDATKRAKGIERVARSCLLESPGARPDDIVVDLEPTCITIDAKKAEWPPQIGGSDGVGQDLHELSRTG